MLILLVKNSIGDGNLINSCPLMYQSVNIQHEYVLVIKKEELKLFGIGNLDTGINLIISVKMT